MAGRKTPYMAGSSTPYMAGRITPYMAGRRYSDMVRRTTAAVSDRLGKSAVKRGAKVKEEELGV